MTIRTRLTLWYAGIMFVSLVAMGILSYHAFAPEPRTQPGKPSRRKRTRTTWGRSGGLSSGAACPPRCWRWAAAGG